MLKRMMACLLMVVLLLSATPMALAAHPYDVDMSGSVTANDALMLLQHTTGKINIGRDDVHILDPLIAYGIATGDSSDLTVDKVYNKTPSDETIWVAADYLPIEGKAGETVSLPVYIEAEKNPVRLFNIQEVAYDHTLLRLTDVTVDEKSDAMPWCVANGDRIQIMYTGYHSKIDLLQVIELQFAVLQDFTEDTAVTVDLQGVSAIVSGSGYQDAPVETEAGEIWAVTSEDLEMIILFAQMLADDTIYTAESVAVLEAALEDAQAVLDDPDATPKDMLDAIEALNAAAEGLVELGETVEGALTQLQELVDEAYQLLAMEHSWSEYTHNNLGAAIDMVERFVNDDTTDMELIQGMYDVLDGAISMLEFVGSFGDVDGDGSVAAADALLTLQAATGKVEFIWAQWMIADVDADEYGEITAGDALMILQYATQKIDSFPIDDMYIE